jgi:hypothetical protein
MTHAGSEAPRVATVHDTVKELGRGLPHPSAVFHAYASMEATQFGDSIYPVYASTFQMLVHQGLTDAGLN